RWPPRPPRIWTFLRSLPGAGRWLAWKGQREPVGREETRHRGGPERDSRRRREHAVALTLGERRNHDELAPAAGSPEALAPELLHAGADVLVVLGVEPHHRHPNLRPDRGEERGHLIGRARLARALLRVAAADGGEREHGHQAVRVLRRGIDRGECARALADQEPALAVPIRIRLRPGDYSEQVERGPLAGAREIGALATAVGVGEMLPAARAVAAPHRDDHRVPPVYPLANRHQ